MAALGSQTIAASYEQLLHVDTDGGGATTTLVPVKDGDNGTTFCLQLATTKAMIEGSGSKLFFHDEGGEYISGDGTDLTITSGNDIVLALGSAGSIYHTGDGGTSNTLYGKDAGDALASGGNYNVLIGEEAGGALTTGDNNVVIGYTALDAADLTESDNIAIGHAAMSAVDEGSHGSALADGNIAIGTNALLGGSFGSSDLDLLGNVAIGYQALDATAGTAQTGNVAIGYQAATALNHADASGTVAIGYQAGAANTIGQWNTAIGFESLKLNVDGDAIVAIGYQALETYEPGDGEGWNVAIGYNAMQAATTAQNSVAIGATAMSSGAVSGDKNIAIGSNALAVVTTGDNNVAIGAGALDTCISGASNICIGRDTMGDLDAGASSADSGSNVFIGDLAGGGAWVDAGSQFNTVVGGGSALGAALNGSNSNTCIGYAAGADMISGDQNTFVGRLAGNSPTDCDNAVCIGYNVSLSGDPNSAVAIGSSFNGAAEPNEVTFGNGSNTMKYDLDAGNITITSDERVKENIVGSSLGLTFIDKLRPVQFNKKAPADWPEEFWNLSNLEEDDPARTSEESGTQVQNGLIAQEVKAVIDELDAEFTGWREESETTKQELSYVAFVTPLIKAVQELSAKVTALENA